MAQNRGSVRADRLCTLPGAVHCGSPGRGSQKKRDVCGSAPWALFWVCMPGDGASWPEVRHVEPKSRLYSGGKSELSPSLSTFDLAVKCEDVHCGHTPKPHPTMQLIRNKADVSSLIA